MKALSFRQPWAELILQGRKTLDLRTWQTHYRGPLAIHASQTVEAAACRAHGLEPKTLTTGALVGTVTLLDVVLLNEAAYEARRSEHLAGRHFRDPMYGWVLGDPRRLPAPRPLRGRMGLFNVEIDQTPVAGEQAPLETSEVSPPVILARWDPERPFELHVTPGSDDRGHTAYALALYQRMLDAPNGGMVYGEQRPPEKSRVVTLRGDALRAVADQVLWALRQADYKATDLHANRREPFLLPEEVGVRLGLLFLAVRPISKMTRIEAISDGVRTMPLEEAYYWYSKCTAGPAAERAQKALRVLLAEE